MLQCLSNDTWAAQLQQDDHRSALTAATEIHTYTNAMFGCCSVSSDVGPPVAPLTKDAIKNAQLSYVGSFKDPEVVAHWTGSGNIMKSPARPGSALGPNRKTDGDAEDPLCYMEDKPRAPRAERGGGDGAKRRASTNTAGQPLKSAVRRPSLGVSDRGPCLLSSEGTLGSDAEPIPCTTVPVLSHLFSTNILQNSFACS